MPVLTTRVRIPNTSRYVGPGPISEEDAELIDNDAVFEDLADEETGDNALETWTVPELKAYADHNEIDLDGATRKADIIAAIELWQEENDPADADDTNAGDGDNGHDGHTIVV